MRAIATFITIVGASFAAACASGSGLPANAPPIAKVWKARCGSCHTRVEPNTRTRAEIDKAMVRHEKRVELTREEWTAMAEWLAPAPLPSPAPTLPPAPMSPPTPTVVNGVDDAGAAP